MHAIASNNPVKLATSTDFPIAAAIPPVMSRLIACTNRNISSCSPNGGNPLNPGHKVFLILGADSTLGRDEFLRLLYGAQVSFEVALLATFGSISIGVLLGSIAGYYRGWIDTIVSRVTEITMAFPVLLFIIALASTIGDSLNNITFGIFGRGVFNLFLILSVFGWYYPARIMRAVVLSLREKEFVEAARMVGASDLRIMRSHVLPHLVAPIVVVSTLIVAQYILAEAGLSFLGLGVKLPTASWGVRLLHDAAVADGLARARRPDHDARLQPPGRRPAGRVRPPLHALVRWLLAGPALAAAKRVCVRAGPALI